MKSNVSFENTQATIHNDVCRCQKCNAESVIRINPDLAINKWECKVCRSTQNWIPSEEYKASVGCVANIMNSIRVIAGSSSESSDSSQLAIPNEKPHCKILPDIVMKQITLDSLVKLDYDEVCAMEFDDALETLAECDDHAARLNEIIGISAGNGYKTEFVSGVLADIGKLRNLKGWLWEVLKK